MSVRPITMKPIELIASYIKENNIIQRKKKARGLVLCYCYRGSEYCML